MSRPLVRRTQAVRTKSNSSHVTNEQQKPNLPGLWICIGDWVADGDPGNDPPCTSRQSPPFSGNWSYVGSPFDFPAFRFGLDGRVEFRGVLDATLETSGSVAFVLPSIYRPEMDTDYHMFVNNGAQALAPAVYKVDASSGQVRVWVVGAQFDIKVFDDVTPALVADGVFKFAIPIDLNNRKLTRAAAYVTTAGGDDLEVMIRNQSNGDVDMLTDPITIDAGELTSYTSAAPVVIDHGNAAIQTADIICIDIDADGDGALGLGVILDF